MVVSEFVQSIQPLMEKFGLTVPDIRVHGMTLDSRHVSAHTAFVAVKGHNLDGRDFIPQAISLGTPVIFAQADSSEEHGSFTMRGNTLIVMVEDLPGILSSLAGAFYDYPANKLTTTAVTGTNGKTSTVNLIAQFKRLLGHRAAVIGTLGSGIYEGNATQWSASKTANTTPDPILMQYLLAEFVQQEVAHVAYEASSHALVQQRLTQIKTDTAVFTNLSRDHLDYHGSMENYAAAKRLLLDQPGLSNVVINADDVWSAEWIKGANQRGLTHCLVSVNNQAPITTDARFCIANNIRYHNSGTEFAVSTSWGDATIQTPLLGEFNVYNLLCALSSLLLQGESLQRMVEVAPNVLPVPGRMEVFAFEQHANVIIDYAHTPDALEKALQALALHTQTDNDSNIWVVFGCGGDRDKGKRPQMGQVAERLADHIIITTDNSRSEEPHAIAQDIMSGLTDPDRVINEPDRETAIRLCLNQAAPNDMILVAGKGHETYQIIDQTQFDYDERAVVARIRQELTE